MCATVERREKCEMMRTTSSVEFEYRIIVEEEKYVTEEDRAHEMRGKIFQIFSFKL